MGAQKILEELQKGLLCWYPFKEDAKVLYIGEKEDALADFFSQKCASLKTISWQNFWGTEGELQETNVYDYVVLPYAIEQTKEPGKILKNCFTLLKENGVLLFGMNNRLGFRFFCGDRDPYTGRNFDGLENYVQLLPKEQEALQGRLYSKAQMDEYLETAGWKHCYYYPVLPNLEAPQMIFDWDYSPKENMPLRYAPRYTYPDTVFLDERQHYKDLADNHMFSQLANAYLVECVKKPEDKTAVLHVTLSTERKEEDAFATVIYSDRAEKRALYPQGQEKLLGLMENERDLINHGLSLVESQMKDEVYTMPYVDAPVGLNYLQEAFRKDKNEGLALLEHYRDLVMRSSEVISLEDAPVCQEYLKGREIDLGPILQKCYVDLVPWNSFFVDGEFVFYDQEFYLEHMPANLILYRTISSLYVELQKYMTIQEAFMIFGISEESKDILRRMEWEFLDKLRNLKEQRVYIEEHGVNYEVLNSNRQRMNFSSLEYQKLFVDIFDGLENKKLFLFGSGKFAQKFVALYGKDYEIAGVLDNSQNKWSQKLEGIEITSPDILKDLDPREYKVIICIKKYLDVLKQLKGFGAKHFGIFDPNMTYKRPIGEGAVKCRAQNHDSQTEESPVKKPYHKGYIAGVFDLFHIGHLNMFRRAKEQCDYLIVGVVSDEGVRYNKKVEPYVPFEERIEMVRSCRYVDEAVEIPLNYGGTKDAYRMYQFDCQFSGSDYQNDPAWLAEKEFLEKQGVDMVFFPYTESTSSTKIKALIDKGLV